MTRLRGVLHTLSHLDSDPDWTLMTDIDPAGTSHRELATALFNSTWQLMEKENRTPDEDALMVHQAHASLYHWLQAGGPEHNARGEWQVSRVYTVLGRGEAALFHARRVLDICRRNGIGDWDLGFAYEALARAHAVLGDADESRRWLAEARQAATGLADADREALLTDLNTIAA